MSGLNKSFLGDNRVEIADAQSLPYKCTVAPILSKRIPKMRHSEAFARTDKQMR